MLRAALRARTHGQLRWARCARYRLSTELAPVRIVLPKLCLINIVPCECEPGQ
jgi:hypothetical protein